MKTCYVHPEVERWWGRTSVVHFYANVAWVPVLIVGVSHKMNSSDQRCEVVRQFIDAQGWKARVFNLWHERVEGPHYVRQRNGGTRKIAPGHNGLMEYCGGSVGILWDWSQVTAWLKDGWPTTKAVRGDVDSPLGTWCYAEGVDPNSDLINRDAHNGWPFASKQMRKLGIHPDVRELRRRMDEQEEIQALCASLKKHRSTLEDKYYEHGTY